MRGVVTYLLIALLSAALLAGCAAMAVSPVTGGLYTDVRAPVTATASETWSKIGSASCASIFGLIGVGDASIKAACRDGKITKIHHVDYHSTNILGIYATYTVYVYGE